ncbi:hypothetical protein ES332_A10G286300v1 [Gossypium tomentosum]|uniref:KIB1-4 beta-propeller domain-containing protein n=1 Tax=Gossypium tomentosum TaxID=34277 RepID=A0A5D2NW74_GOSTO|nr:hypothetical protein ES332_A10G286300v1 [Gossypium tomentosum]
MLSKEKTIADVPSWANILDDVLRRIATLTRSLRHHIRMTAVCRSWRASLADQKINFPAVCLMLQEDDISDNHCVYSISEEIFDKLDLPELQEWRSWGSPFGWLVTHDLNREIRLFNPFSRASFPLPKNSWCIEKLILSINPEESNSNCIVFAIYWGFLDRGRIGFAKLGDLAWRTLMFDDDDDGGGFLWDDVIYFKFNFYGCLNSGEIFLFEDLNGAHPKSVKFASRTPNFHGGRTCYLFHLDGNLCMTCRDPFDVDDGDDDDEDIGYTIKFVIFKLDMDTKSWKKIYSLGDRSLFLGNCCTFTVAAADYPGCKPNCIYSTDASIDVADIGIYDVEKNRDKDIGLEPFPMSKPVEQLLSFAPPVWIIPYPPL